jgi:Anti-sigma factor NepR
VQGEDKEKPMSSPTSVSETAGEHSAVSRSTNIASDSEPTTRKGLDARIQAHLGGRLRAIYDDVLKQPVPGRFRRLLDELEAKTSESRPPEDGHGKKSGDAR